MDEFKSIEKNFTHEYIVKKSKFICNLQKVNTTLEAEDFISLTKKKYKDASHTCSAYIINRKEKVSDDGEPSGTAGLPMLEVLKHHQLNYIVCTVTRYFGGIKLGAGGIIRAYSKSVSESIKNAPLKTLTSGYIYKLSFTYDKVKLIDYTLNNNHFKIINKEFSKFINYYIQVKKKDINKFKDLINTIDYSTSLEKGKETLILEGDFIDE